VSGTDPVDPALARLLESPALWAEVSDDWREQTLALAIAETATARPPARTRWLLAAAAAVVVVLGVTGGLVLTRGGTEPAGVEVALAGTADAPGAGATVHLRDEPAGVAVVLEIDGLPPAPEGFFYEAWLVGETGKVSAGTFHHRGDQDEIQLWLGVDTEGYEALTVTRQPIDGGTLAEGVVVLRGELPG
jgi:hypothetical protein